MGAGILWPIKTSLTAYIESLDDGRIDVKEPAERRPEGFWFPLREGGAATGPGGSMAFAGSVRLSGHWGMLDVEFQDPRVDFDDAGAVLHIRERGGSNQERFVAISRLTRQPTAATGAATFATVLTGEGAFLLGGQYPAGTALSPVMLYPANP